ncbi:unnamed protein product [marine sediment metagenome]|uniref:DUF3846 domain-containing protein n=1 Tax=marine sediment metagenome TaxID=412755 RepID=X1C523_9ZZZZ
MTEHSFKKECCLLIKAEGGFEKVYSKESKFTLEEYQSFVAGHIEQLPEHYLKEEYKNFVFYVNEEGLVKGLKRNKNAEFLLDFKKLDEYFEWIAGDVIILGGDNFRELTKNQIKKFLQ